ncbi:LuxR C-terminal-related transcriptional regulator [Streptosporangium sp. DT93]|uniref:response regulator transcription factor n=1 Tax=Streptosporangium sp. DT93 TaxID=3393428 RepID=UPI003CF1CADB
MSSSVAEIADPPPAVPSVLRMGDLELPRPGLSVFWLAEDDISHHGLPPLLMKVPDVARVAVGRDAAEAGALLRDEDFDVAVIPLAALPQVLDGVPPRARPRIVVLTRREEAGLVPALVGGYDVAGYLVRDEIDVAGLFDTFERVLRGDVPVPPAAAREPVAGVEHGVPGAGPHPVGRLTGRERAVLGLLLRGMSNHQIARSMEISIHGVKRHVSNLLVKFNCSNRTEVALIAERLGMESFQESNKA